MIKTLEKIIRSIVITGAATLLTASASFAQDFTEQELTWFKNRRVDVEYAKKLYEIKNPDGTRLYDAKQIIDASEAHVKIEDAIIFSTEKDEEGKPLFFPIEIAEFAKLGITPEYFRQFRAIKDENGPLFSEHDIMDAWRWKIKADEIKEYALELAKIKDKKGYPMFRRSLMGLDEICRAWIRKLDIQYARELAEYTDKDGQPVFTVPYEIFSAYKTGLDLKKDKEYLESLLSIKNTEGKRAFNGGDLISAKELGLEVEYAIAMNSIQIDGKTVFDSYSITDAKKKKVAYEYASEIAAIRRSDGTSLVADSTYLIIDYSTKQMPIEYAKTLAMLNDSKGKPLLNGYEVGEAFTNKFSIEEVKGKAKEIEEYKKKQHFDDYFTDARRK